MLYHRVRLVKQSNLTINWIQYLYVRVTEHYTQEVGGRAI